MLILEEVTERLAYLEAFEDETPLPSLCNISLAQMFPSLVDDGNEPIIFAMYASTFCGARRLVASSCMKGANFRHQRPYVVGRVAWLGFPVSFESHFGIFYIVQCADPSVLYTFFGLM